MADLRCENCVHWELANAWAANAENRSRFERYDHVADEWVIPKSSLRWSRCQAAEAGFDESFNAEERKMAAWDGSRYHAELITREDFLCCEHAARADHLAGETGTGGNADERS